MRSIEYEPRNVKEILTEMKDTSELMVDLAYSAILFKNPEIAQEVRELEERMNVLVYHARIGLMLAARNTEDAEQLAGVFQIVDAAEKIANAATDIALILVDGLGVPDEMRQALPEAQEAILRAEVGDTSPLANTTLGDQNLETETGVHVIAIRRDNEWLLDPGRDTQLSRGDVILGEGPPDGVDAVHEMATGAALVRDDADVPRIAGIDRAVAAIVDMKNLSELAVGLAYAAALLDDETVASEVQALEADTDGLMRDLEVWVLESAQDVDDPRELRGLIHLAISSEVITDAARDMADAVLRDVDVHPVFEQAVEESNEVIATVEVEEESALDGATLGDREVETDTGMHVMAVRRGSDWVFSPTATTPLGHGDVVIARGTRAGAERLRGLATTGGGA